MRSKFTVLDAPHHADDVVALVEQELGEIRAVLSGDAGDERTSGHIAGLSCPARAVCQVGWQLIEIPDPQERLGRRIAAHRAKLGWTQQELADRLAISRVAVSHLEAGMSTPGERTVALLASIFKVAPHEFVRDTDYPAAKADRLPSVVAHHTEVELQLSIFDNDVRWLEHATPQHAEQVLDRWNTLFIFLRDQTHDARERAALDDALRRLRSTISDQRTRR